MANPFKPITDYFYPAPKVGTAEETGASMDVAQTPEPKSSSGLASVFKNFTGSKTSKAHGTHSTASATLQSNNGHTSKNAIYGGPPNFDILYEQLKAGHSVADRISAAESLRHAVQDYPLSSVTNIFKEGKDLIEPTNSKEARNAGFELLTACTRHASSTDPERLAYFQVITAPANVDDFHLQLAAFIELANHGRDLSGFHYAVIPLLTTWLKDSWTSAASARRLASRANTRTGKGKAPLGEETNLALLFAFIVDVIKFSFNVSTEETTEKLIDEVLHICVSTPLPNDLKSCITVIDAIVTYGEIPASKLLDCVKVLCSIHCLVDSVQSAAWRSISNLSRSHNGQTMVRIILNILQKPNLDRSNDKQFSQSIREIRGALSVLEKLFAKDGENGYPLVPFTLLIGALTNITSVDHARVEADVLRLILSIFSDEDQEVMENVMEEDWSTMFDVVSKCSQRLLSAPNGQPTSRSRVSSPLRGGSVIPKDEAAEQNLTTTMSHTLHSLITRIEELLVTSTQGDFYQRHDCIKFFVKVHAHLPESCAKLVIDYYMEFRCCYPSDVVWKENIQVILKAFFADRSQPTHIRLHALKAVTDVFDVVELMGHPDDPDRTKTFVTAILDDVGDEKDISILQEVVAFAVSVAGNAGEALFSYIIDSIRSSITSDRLQSPLGSPPGSRPGLMSPNRPTSSTHNNLVQTPSNVVTRGLVQIFMRTMDKSASKSLRVFEELLWIAKSHDCETDARISVLKMLFRLRADWANRIFLTPFTESDGLAASLYRTTTSLARKHAADEALQQARLSRNEESASRAARSTSISQGPPQARSPFRLTSGVYRATQRNHQMWMSPDPDALPEAASNRPSPLLASIVNAEGTSDTTALNVAAYLDTIILLLERGCDWEIYSYILVHLPSQLANQALFKSATPQIKSLRTLLCDQIINGTFYDPLMSSGLRKADVAICLFQMLTMIVSYHQEFTKADQDEIVRTFLQGIGAWERAAKCCIHALTICCHELPGSTSKALTTILQKMSQIITQQHVAIHILEFLVCLARLPDLYVNFREDQYRTVFAIAFRYLQYVREKEASKDLPPQRSSYPHTRNSMPSPDSARSLASSNASESNLLPNSSDDLPQYLYALAYHVITFWFLALKLTDRAGQVAWITKNLVSTDINGKEKIDQQAQVTMDFMQRVAFADVDESAADATFTSERFGEILKKRWIIGHSIVTVEQATRGGWAQITKRQPSGTSCFIIREQFTRPPPHQSVLPTDAVRDARRVDANVVLPSHLLLQLTASSPQLAASQRPIPLPDDDQTRRAIAMFDRNSTVDGHKVGVIYLGEGQTHEVEILANIMGSSDYMEFLTGLGTLTRLEGAKFNTQGLDREHNTDGEYTYCWRDRVTEIVFHVTTQMPTNLDHDPQCINKKKHIGNDFVNIIFNNSGLPFKYDTFPSEFNYVNIIITPESRASFVATRFRSQAAARSVFYKVQVMSKPGFPEISPAAETKIVSLAALPGFIRLLALNASVFSLVWANREGGEHVSPWRNRLREIHRLRLKHTPKSSASTHTSPPGTSSGAATDPRNIRDSINSIRRTSVVNFNFLSSSSEPTSQRSSVLSTADTEVGPSAGEESVLESLDFSKWA